MQTRISFCDGYHVSMDVHHVSFSLFSSSTFQPLARCSLPSRCSTEQATVVVSRAPKRQEVSWKWLSWKSSPLRHNSCVTGEGEHQNGKKNGETEQLMVRRFPNGRGFGRVSQQKQKRNSSEIRMEEEEEEKEKKCVTDLLSSEATILMKKDRKHEANLEYSELDARVRVSEKRARKTTIDIVSHIQFYGKEKEKGKEYEKDEEGGASTDYKEPSLGGTKAVQTGFSNVRNLTVRTAARNLVSAASTTGVDEIMERMVSSNGNYRNDWEMMGVLRELGLLKRPKVALKVWQWWRKRKSYSPNVHHYTMMLTILGRGKMIKECFLLLDDMRASGCPIDAPPYNAMITALGRVGETDKAVEIFRRMEASNPPLRPTVVTYGALLMTLTKAGRLQEAKELLERMLETDCKPNMVVFNTLISAFGEAGDIQSMENLLETMRQQGLTPDGVTYTSLVHAYRICGLFRKVAETWEELTMNKCKKDTALYTEMICLEGQLGRVAEMEEVFSEMCNSGIEPDKLTFAALITGFGNHGDCMKMDTTLRFMRAIGCQPDATVYASVLRAYGRRGLIAGIERVRQVMHVEGCSSNRLIFEILILEYGRSGLIDRMEHSVREMITAGFSLQKNNFNNLVVAYSNAGLLGKMEDTIELMRQRRFRPSCQTWEYVMDAYEREGLQSQAAYARKFVQGTDIKRGKI